MADQTFRTNRFCPLFLKSLYKRPIHKIVVPTFILYFPFRALRFNIYSFNRQMHTAVITFKIILLITLNSYKFQTLLVHHHGVH